MRISATVILGLLAAIAPTLAAEIPGPLVLGHRGASGYVPEHTLTSYFIAIQQGADYIEPDLVSTQDGVLIARHENEISGTTDVANRPEFASKKRTKTVDGVRMEGWFTEDFTLAEIKRLRARERLPKLRPANMRFDGQFEIPTFDEVLTLVQELERMRGSNAPRIGVSVEIKHSTYFQSAQLPIEDSMLRSLKERGYQGKDAPVIIQSFEVSNLQALRKKTELPLLLLMESSGAPYDYVARSDKRTYADLATAQGLREVAQFATWIGVDKSMVLPRDANDALQAPTGLVRAAHSAGLKVVVWTLRAENEFLPKDFRLGGDPATQGNIEGEVDAFLRAGVDGVFADHPFPAVRARNRFKK